MKTLTVVGLIQIVGLILCFLTIAFMNTLVSAQGSIAPGVHASTFPNGTVCYTNSAGGIFCMR